MHGQVRKTRKGQIVVIFGDFWWAFQPGNGKRIELWSIELAGKSTDPFLNTAYFSCYVTIILENVNIKE